MQRMALAVGLIALAAAAAGSLLLRNVRALDGVAVATLVAAGLAWLAVRRVGGRSPGMRWFALGLTAYALGQLIAGLQGAATEAHFVSSANLLQWLFAAAIACGLFVEADRLARPGERRRLLLGAANLAVAVAGLVLVAHLPWSGAAGPPALAAMVVFPVSVLAAASLGLVAVFVLRVKFSRCHALFLVALAATGAGAVAANLARLAGEGTAATWLQNGLALAALGLGVGAFCWRFERSASSAHDRRSEGFLRMLPIGAILIAVIAVLWGTRAAAAVPTSLVTLIEVGALLVIVLAVFKQSLQLREYDQLKQLTAQLEENEWRTRLILRSLPDPVWLKDADGVYLMCNSTYERLFDLPENGMIGKTDFDLFDPELARFFRGKDEEAIAAGGPHVNEERVRYADGRPALLETVKTPLRDRDGRLMGVLGIARDITERERAHHQLSLVDFALNHVQEAAYLVDEAGRFVYVNDEACRALEWTRGELLTLGPTSIDHDISEAPQWCGFWEQVRDLRTMTFETRHRTRNGRVFPVEINANYFEFSGSAYVLALARDITERKAVEAQIRDLAYYDPLTRLPNRRLLMDRLGHALAASSRSGVYGALMILDLDHFKTLNDTLGHDVGDRLLVEVAHRLDSSVRREDTVARLGGDEFVVMLEGLGDDAARAASQAEAVAEKIRVALIQPHVLTDHVGPFYGTTSIGLTLFGPEASSVDLLLKQADLALYQAKDAGRDVVRFFNPAMQAAIDSRAASEAALRQALERREFRLYYQPQVNQYGELIGAEALLRWPGRRHPLATADFIALAEETGLIVPIGRWVLDTACAQLKAWENDPRAQHLHMSVNVSARQFHEPDFVATVRQSVADSGINPAGLKLELTETVVLQNVDAVVSRMDELRALGVSFSLDDFGTGYSSLSYLKRLPLDQVKIDQSFVRDVTDDPNDAAIVMAILAMSRSLGLQVVAEGVETATQQDFLLKHGCKAYQGNHFCRPLPIEQWERLLK